MKKLFILILTVSFIVFAGCDLFQEPGGEDYKEATTNIKINSQGDAFLVKLNKSMDKIGKSYTGKVTKTHSRSVQEVIEGNYPDQDSFIRQLNVTTQTLLSENLVNSSREAEESSVIKDDINELIFAKGSENTFWSFTQQGETYNTGIPGQVSATCKYVGKHCYVFADDNNSKKEILNVTNSEYEEIGKKFDACYELETKINGDSFYKKYHSTYFVPCNDKIIILVSDLFGDAKLGQEEQGGVLGYFYNGDLFKQEYLDTYIQPGVAKSNANYIHSNGIELFYIDAYFLNTDSMRDTVYSTLVHEFNHMINFVIKILGRMTKEPNSANFALLDSWYTEMLSMVTEDMFQDYLGLDDVNSPKGRLPYFNNFYNYGFKLWNDNTVDPNYMYANTYAFGAFIARNYGGVDLITEIAQNDYVNEISVTRALQKINPDIEGLDFAKALEKFSFSFFDVQDSDGRIYSFNKDAGTKSNVLYFSAIDIDHIEFNGNKYYPKIYEYNENVDLWPYGFSVHYLGRNLESVDLIMNDNGKIDYHYLY